jgi:O-antigen ligase
LFLTDFAVRDGWSMTAVEHRSATPLHATVPIASGQLRARDTGHRALNWLAILIPPVIAGYILFDRAFAYIHVPPIPLFVGEFVVLVAVVAALVATGHIHRAIRHSTAVKLLIVFALWGVLRTIPYVGTYHVNAIRDAALWYYSLLAIPICALVLRDAELVTRWAGMYRRFIPWFLVFSPIALLFGSAFGTHLNILVPGSNVSIWDHKPGNIAVNVAIAVAFLWLVPNAAGRYRPLLTGLSTVVLLIVFTQNRGGSIAAAAGLAWVWLFAKRRGRMTLAVIATVCLVVLAGWSSNIQVRTAGGRTISVNQLVENFNSVIGGGSTQSSSSSSSSSNLNSTVQFRKNLWSAVITKVKAEKRVLTGLGFGIDIAKEVGFQGGADTQLRSPHNSHVDVFARMGLIGLAIWVAFWGFFFFTALRTRWRFLALGRSLETGLVGVCIAGVTAILVNAYFDPTLEGAQVAIWLWTLVGLTFGLAALSRRATTGPPAPSGLLRPNVNGN